VSSQKKSLHAAEQDRTDVKARREAWQAQAAGLDVSRLVFLDESGAKTNMTRLYGRSFDGRRVVAAAPHGHWCTTTIVAAMRVDGRTEAMVLEGPTDTEVFETYVGQVLLPSLRPGDIVVLDNLAPHKKPGVIAMIEAVGAEVWFLPPYSPDFNPIEKMWSKIKAFLRKAEARTRETLLAAIKAALQEVTGSDARHWFQSCGYTQA
jgi:transposase